jgi:N-acetylglucosaminyldiphosphoundecaprenol N-acetyl-beta-D-mannosaminyltransferase
LTQSLTALNPRLTICGTYSPPFRPLTEAEDNELVEQLNSAKPNIVWIGLGCPKQELWMAQHAARVPGAIMIGVGAAFDFLSGRIPRAPRWMQNSGLEWLHRLLTEPRRLWKRYLVFAPMFAVLAAVETTAIWCRRPPNRKEFHRA